MQDKNELFDTKYENSLKSNLLDIDSKNNHPHTNSFEKQLK